MLPLKKRSYISAALLLCKKERKKNCLVVLHRDELQYVQVSLSSETMFKSFFFELFLKKGPLPSIAKGNNKKELFFSSLHTEKARELVHYSLTVHP